MAGGDTPDFYDTTTPDVNRWSPGTEYGSAQWADTIAALTSQSIFFSPTDDGYQYVLDSLHIDSYIIGDMHWAIAYYENGYPGTPIWIACGHDYGHVNVHPFNFVSLSFSYPGQMQFIVYNSNVYARYMRLIANFYKYLTD
jgi:hypothetical protein